MQPIETTIVASSRPHRGAYVMERYPSGWVHEGLGCEWWWLRRAWQQMHPCRHVLQLEVRNMTQEEANERAIAVYTPAELPTIHEMVDEFDAALIVAGVAPDRVEQWCYAFKQQGDVIVGLSIAGVPAAVREMAKHGEVIRCDEPRIVYENDDEVRLTCTARRILVAPDGREVELDQTSRALRQLKYQLVNEWEDDGRGGRRRTGRKLRVDDDKWFEKAHSKAVRNATIPLIRDDCRSAIIEAFKQTEKYAEVLNEGGRPQPARQQRQAAPRQQAQSRPANNSNGATAAERAEGVADQTSAPAAPSASPPAAPKTPAGSEEGAISSFWAAVRLAKLDVPKVTEISKERFDGRVPMDLTPQERATFLADLTRPGAEKPAAVSVEDHTAATGHHNPAFTPEGAFICGDCEAVFLDAIPA